MWNTLNRIFLGKDTPKEKKFKAKELMNNLDSHEGKKEARKFIRANSKGTWFSWRG